jgi:hypothetical protein
MLDIQTTLITICLAETYGYWHSLYLDQHGEEDPKLKLVLISIIHIYI